MNGLLQQLQLQQTMSTAAAQGETLVRQLETRHQNGMQLLLC